MSLITEKFKQLADDQNVKFKDRVVEQPIKNKDGEEVTQKQHAFQTGLQVNKDKVVPCSVIIQESPSDRVNYQITYNRIGYVTDRNKIGAVLEELNELNRVRSGYYHFAISKDGELIMRNLGITGEDVRPLINTFVFGARILRALYQELDQISGLDLSQSNQAK
mgnify:FL=1